MAAPDAIQTCTTCVLHAEAVFRVEGMDCQEEVVILERRLTPLAGIEAISADLMGQRLHVKYDAASLTAAAIVDAVGQTGMRMWLEHDEPTEGSAGTEWRWRLMVVCAVAIGAGLILSAGGRALDAAVCFTVAAVAGGIYPARRAVVAVRSRTLDINTLMVVAVSGALLLGQWFEAASVVFLFAVAQWLEVRTLERARQAIRSLIDLAPREAVVRRAGVEHRVAVDDVRIGDEILIRPGDKMPLDGVVVSGQSDVNQAPLTGESVPVDRVPGDEVFAGTINGHGALDVRVTRLVRDTRVARIIHLVEAAQASRAPVQSFVDRFARVYTPLVLVVALAVGLIPPLLLAADPAVWIIPRAGAAGDRVPLCPGDLDAGLDRVGALGGRAKRRAHQGWRTSRAAGGCACGGVRQDRHVDDGRVSGRRGPADGAYACQRTPGIRRSG